MYVTFSKSLLEECGWRQLPQRNALIQFLDEQQIKWLPCGDLPRGGWILEGYEGHIYIDIAPNESSLTNMAATGDNPDNYVNFTDEEDVHYSALCNYLENADGSTKHEGVRFNYIMLQDAQSFAAMYEHDD